MNETEWKTRRHRVDTRPRALNPLADPLEMRLAKAHGQMEQLTPYLLDHAFSGQLVPRDPTDKPASALLERIRRHPKSQSP